MTDQSRPSALAVVAVLLLLGVGVGWWFAAGGDSAPLPRVDAAPDVADPEADTAPQIASVPVTPLPAGAEPEPESGPMLRLPDGTSVPNLNGVKVPVKFRWTRNYPYSPIVGKRLAKEPGDWEWYEHADGSLSTTVMLYRDDLGREDATSFVATPKDNVPLDPQLAQQAYEEGLLGTNPPPAGAGKQAPGK
ncbi:MAG: hypothetical protein KDE27_24090 [Planctomycetes bacterium]|nr:hypothetical protein [Planctomycetota bacterium]